MHLMYGCLLTVHHATLHKKLSLSLLVQYNNLKSDHVHASVHSWCITLQHNRYCFSSTLSSSHWEVEFQTAALCDGIHR